MSLPSDEKTKAVQNLITQTRTNFNASLGIKFADIIEEYSNSLRVIYQLYEKTAKELDKALEKITELESKLSVIK